MSKRVRVGLIICAAISALLVGGGFLVEKGNPLSRRAWKNKALAEISGQIKNPAWLPTELASMQAASDPIESGTWLSRNLIVMTNGDWIAYRSICRKQNFWIPDLFIGKGSDNRW